MIEDDQIISEANVAYVAGKILGSNETGNRTKTARLATIARYFGLTRKDLYLDKPVCAGNLKYFVNEYMKNVDKFKDYTLLDYIGTSYGATIGYINTGVVPTSKTKVILYFDAGNGGRSYNQQLFGNNSFGAKFDSNAMGIGCNSNSLYTTYSFSGYQSLNVICIDAKNKKAYLNGVETTPANSNTQFGNGHLGLFCGLSGKDSAFYNTQDLKIYFCDIYEDDVPIRKFIPARRKSDGRIGLLDVVNFVFYTSPNGAGFIYGSAISDFPNLAKYSYEYLEYVQSPSSSSGHSVFKTGFIPNQNTRLVMNMEKTSKDTNGSEYIFCSRYSNNPAYGILKRENVTYWRDDYNNDRTNCSMSNNSLTQKRTYIDKNKNSTKIGKISVNHSYSSFTLPNELVLMGCLENGTDYGYYTSNMRIYWCQIYDNGTLIRNYFPMRNKNTGKAGLYDFVNDTFIEPYGNDVIAGPTIAIA